MRILSLLVVVAAACVSNPDPRATTVQQVLRDGHGGWIQIEHTDGTKAYGELIAVGQFGVVVLEANNVVANEPFSGIKEAELYEYNTEYMHLVTWGILGTVSSVSHGLFAVFSIPVWLATSITAAAFESRSARLSYPGDTWTEMARWARFPQGMPPGLSPQDVLRQDRKPPPPPEPPPPPPDDAGIDAPTVDAP